MGINTLSGVYAIVNPQSRKVYIGSTVNLSQRRQAHFTKSLGPMGGQKRSSV